jgi:putative 4-mercaptohistidine N1-methyltranferase
MNPYETDKLLREYLLFHYGKPEEVMPWPNGPQDGFDYAIRCVTECLDAAALPPGARALDLGCAVGRSTFELARSCREVIGVDYSARFIEAARRLAEAGRMAYTCAEEGMIERDLIAEVPMDIDRTRVQFQHGDAQDLPADLGSFDVVLGANLVDRLSKPRQFLARLSRLVNPGGQLILTSPYTWLPEYTPAEEWVGGTVTAGKPQTTLEGLKLALEAHFEFRGTKDLPFLIREHARKYQWSVAQASLWRRRA